PYSCDVKKRSTMLPYFRRAGYETIDDHPNNGALATRFILNAFFFIFNVAFTLCFFPPRQKVGGKFLILFAISILLLVWRTVKESEAYPFEIFAVLSSLDPEGYTVNVTRPEDLAGVEGAALDEPVANDDDERCRLGCTY
ncbi:hypothetical protein TNIN_477071, partial [Trichonephila inaurata madagascariensis]